MFRAIITKYHGPTNTLGSRVIATIGDHKYTHHWDYGAGNGTIHNDVDANHCAAAAGLAAKMGWDGAWIGGGMPNGEGNCYVRLPADAVVFKDSIAFQI